MIFSNGFMYGLLIDVKIIGWNVGEQVVFVVLQYYIIDYLLIIKKKKGILLWRVLVVISLIKRLRLVLIILGSMILWGF